MFAAFADLRTKVSIRKKFRRGTVSVQPWKFLQSQSWNQSSVSTGLRAQNSSAEPKLVADATMRGMRLYRIRTSHQAGGLLSEPTTLTGCCFKQLGELRRGDRVPALAGERFGLSRGREAAWGREQKSHRRDSNSGPFDY